MLPLAFHPYPQLILSYYFNIMAWLSSRVTHVYRSSTLNHGLELSAFASTHPVDIYFAPISGLAFALRFHYSEFKTCPLNVIVSCTSINNIGYAFTFLGYFVVLFVMLITISGCLFSLSHLRRGSSFAFSLTVL